MAPNDRSRRAANADAQRFADTVITQLRSGAPFPVVAAQFSQSQTALQGGDLGWVRANQLDPETILSRVELYPVDEASDQFERFRAPLRILKSRVQLIDPVAVNLRQVRMQAYWGRCRR